MPAHADYLAASRERQWRGGPLPELFRSLLEEADGRPGVQCWRVLFSGAFVMVRRLPSGRHQLRIARKAPPKDPEKGPAKFLAECDTFHRDFGTADWIRQDDPETKGICCEWLEPELVTPATVPPATCEYCPAAVDTAARLAGATACHECQAKVKRGLVLCSRCKQVWIPKDDSFEHMNCQGCAVEAGREYTAEVRARRAAGG